MSLLISLIREKKTEITLSSIVVPCRLTPKKRKHTKKEENQNNIVIENEDISEDENDDMTENENIDNIDDEFDRSINEYYI